MVIVALPVALGWLDRNRDGRRGERGDRSRLEELELSAIAYGASQVVVLVTAEEAPQYLDGLQAQMDVAQAILHGLGYTGTHLQLLRAASPTDLDAGLQALATTMQKIATAPARFAVMADKRGTLDLALDHLIAQAPLAESARPQAIALPAPAAPFGSVTVDKDRCTLCLSCVSACPAALHRKKLCAVRPVRGHLPGTGAGAAAAPVVERRTQGGPGAQ